MACGACSTIGDNYFGGGELSRQSFVIFRSWRCGTTELLCLPVQIEWTLVQIRLSANRWHIFLGRFPPQLTQTLPAYGGLLTDKAVHRACSLRDRSHTLLWCTLYPAAAVMICSKFPLTIHGKRYRLPGEVVDPPLRSEGIRLASN